MRTIYQDNASGSVLRVTPFGDHHIEIDVVDRNGKYVPSSQVSLHRNTAVQLRDALDTYLANAPPTAEGPSAPTVSTAGSMLREAAATVEGARHATHGDKKVSFDAIAGLWNAYLSGRKGGAGTTLTSADVAWLLVLQKIGRSIQGQPIRDHYVDAAGYAAIAGELAL